MTDELSLWNGEALREWASLCGVLVAPGETDEQVRDRLRRLYFAPIDTPELNAHFPHECPRCSGPAYIGFSKVECQRGCV